MDSQLLLETVAGGVFLEESITILQGGDAEAYFTAEETTSVWLTTVAAGAGGVVIMDVDVDAGAGVDVGVDVGIM